MTQLQKDKAVLAVAIAVLAIVLSAAMQSLWGLDAGLLFLSGQIFGLLCHSAGNGIRKRQSEGEK